MYIPYKLRVLYGMLFRRYQGETVIRASFIRTFGRELNYECPALFLKSSTRAYCE